MRREVTNLAKVARFYFLKKDRSNEHLGEEGMAEEVTVRLRTSGGCMENCRSWAWKTASN